MHHAYPESHQIIQGKREKGGLRDAVPPNKRLRSHLVEHKPLIYEAERAAPVARGALQLSLHDRRAEGYVSCCALAFKGTAGTSLVSRTGYAFIRLCDGRLLSGVGRLPALGPVGSLTHLAKPWEVWLFSLSLSFWSVASHE